jgi:hypothetical protein
MLGFGFHIYRKIGDKAIPASATSEQGEWLASWEAGLSGLDWLEELVDQQKAICLQEGFYPGIYSTQAKKVLPLLQDEPPYVITGLEWTDKENPKRCPLFHKSEEVIHSCLPDEWLIVKVWDLS